MISTALLLLLCFEISVEAGDVLPPVIDMLTLTECEEGKVPPPDGFSCETNIAGEGPEKSFTGKITMPFDLDNSIKYRASMKKWVDNEWKEMSFKLSGIVCEHGPKYLPGIWEKPSKVLNVPLECPLKAGTYSVNDFKAEPSDVKLPFSVPGKFLISVVLSKDDTSFACKQSEITITKS